MVQPRPEHDAEMPEPFAALMVDYDEALAAGSIPVPSDATQGSAPALLPDQLRAAVNCLEMLERERRRRAVDAEPSQDSIADDSDDSPPSAEPDLHSFLATPTDSRIGRFEIVRELGRGGQAVVFLARDPALHRQVALKVPRPDILVTPAMRRRFLREGKAAAQLSHPNLVTVYEAGELGPICYLTQAYCAGTNLAEWLRVQPLVEHDVAARIVADLADGVAHAHDRGVLHRDIKPSNILLESKSEPNEANPHNAPSPHGTFDFVPKLTDFGLAKVLEPDGDETATGAVLGTAAYMSPEQANAAHGTVGPATDVYGLGAILYELLAAQPAFQGPSHADTLRQVAAEEPVSLRSIRRNTPRDLEAICLRCLEKKPSRRYASATHLADDLRRFLRREPTVARPLQPHERTLKWAKRNPAAAALICVSILALTALVASSTLYSISLSRALAASQASEQRARELLYVSEMSRAHEAWNRHNSRESLDILKRLRPARGLTDLRGFAWRHLWSTAHDYEAELVGHEGDVYSVAASRDGQYWATAGKDGTVRLWSAEGQPLRVLRAHVGEADYVTFSPDSQTLASGGDDGTVRLWDVATGVMSRVLTAGSAQISTLTYSPDGTRIAASGNDGTVWLWRAEDGMELWSHQAHDKIAHSVAFSADGAQLVTTGNDHALRVWDVSGDRPQLAHEFTTKQPARCADFADGGASLVVGFMDGEYAVLDAETGENIDPLGPNFFGPILAQCLDEDRNVAVATSADGTACLCDYKRRQVLRVFQGQTDRLWSVALAPNKDILATASADGTVRLWPFSLNHKIPQASGVRWSEATDFKPQALDLSHDGKLVALGSFEGEVAVFDAALKNKLYDLAPHSGRVLLVQFSPDAKWLASISDTGQVRVTEVAGGKILFDRVYEGDPQALAFGRDASWLALGSFAGWIEVLDTDTWQAVERFESQVAVPNLVLSPDGGTLVVPHGYILKAWDTASWKLRFQIARPGGAFSDAAFSPDGRTLATAESPRIIGLRDARNGALLQTLTGHDDDVRCVAFSPGGRTLASVGMDRLHVHLWDVQTGLELCKVELPLSIQTVNKIAFDLRGTALYALVGRVDRSDYLISWRADINPKSNPLANDFPPLD